MYFLATRYGYSLFGLLGYRGQLAGEGVPPTAVIFTRVDEIDAITTHLPFQPLKT